MKVNLTINRTVKNLYIHKAVAVAFLGHLPDGMNIIVDHIDNNKSNNNLNNLQLITQRRNLSKDRKNETSKYTGVSWNKKENKWISRIYLNGKRYFLGSFKTEIEASSAYKKALDNL